MKIKTYEIDSFEKLLNVATSENFERLSLDLLKWLSLYVAHLEGIRKSHPKETEGKMNWELIEADFQWIDDGKNDLKYAEIIDKRTGEKTQLKIKKAKGIVMPDIEEIESQADVHIKRYPGGILSCVTMAYMAGAEMVIQKTT